jgi:hypothetical protein
MKIIAQYNSDWGSQTITSSCQIDTDTLQITDIQEVDVDELGLQHCEREYVEVALNNGDTIELPVENSVLAPEGRKILSDVIHLLKEKQFTDIPMSLVKVAGSTLDLIESKFDCFTRTQDSDEVILDAISLGEDEIIDLSFIVGFDATPLAGCYITFQKG